MADETKDVITGGTFNLTKYGVPLALGGLFGAVLVGAQQFKAAEISEPITMAAFAIVAVGVAAATLVAITDYVARAYVTARQPATPPSAKTSSSGDGPSERTAQTGPTGPTAHAGALAVMPSGLRLRMAGRGESPFIMLAVHSDGTNQGTRYLIAKAGGRPEWVNGSEIDSLLKPATWSLDLGMKPQRMDTLQRSLVERTNREG
jgi:hypothetical protein